MGFKGALDSSLLLAYFMFALQCCPLPHLRCCAAALLSADYAYLILRGDCVDGASEQHAQSQNQHRSPHDADVQLQKAKGKKTTACSSYCFAYAQLRAGGIICTF